MTEAKEQVQQTKQPAIYVTNSHKLRVPGCENGIQSLKSKVAIVGFAPSSMTDVKPYFNDPNFEIWGINQLYIAFPKMSQFATRWFQIHHRTEYDTALRDHKHHAWLAGNAGATPQAMPHQGQFPIYMQDPVPEDIPMAIPFPKDEIVDYFGKYFTNSISWEIALAIYETAQARKKGWVGFTDIFIFGVDMATNEEYCLSPDTRVLTADLRWRPIGDVKIGDKLIAFDENSPIGEQIGNKRQWRCATVEKADPLNLPCYKIYFEDGTEIIASADHRWLTHTENEYKWRATKDLVTPRHRPGRPTKIAKLLDVWEENRSWDAGYLAGAYDGEGSISQIERPECNGKCVRLGYSQKQNDMLEQTAKSLAACGFKFTRTEKIKEKVFTYYLQGGRPETLRFLGQIRPRRILKNFKPDMLGVMYQKYAVAVERIEDVGVQPVIGLKTSTGTFVAEGFASHNSEQRPSCEFFVGWARGMGINVYIPAKSDLCKTLWLYPYEDESPFKQKIAGRRVELRNRMQGLAAQEQAAHDERLSILGALDNMNYIEQTWCLSRKELAMLKNQGMPEPPPQEEEPEILIEVPENDDKQNDNDNHIPVVGPGDVQE
jgi:hypothetical protein